MKATFHVVFDAKIGSVYRGAAGEPGRWVEEVKEVRAKRMSKGVPSVNGGEIAVKFEVDIPDAAFLRLMPEVEVELSNGHWTSMPVKVLTMAPEEEEPNGS